ncbi:MAG: acyl carrier protein [Oscillospiraceae bacterium]|nr:acyl carrier protein [Oscillospiraceae bacterium]
MDELLTVLKELKPDVDFQQETHLIDEGILTSLDIMSLAMALDDTFDIELTPLDLIPENFQSAEALDALVKRLQAEN